MTVNVKAAVAKAAAKLAPRLWAEIEIARRNRHFEAEFWLLPQLCRGADVAVDVGGNRGLFAYYMAKSARQVHVFEPNPICLAQLARLHRRNIAVHPFALSSEPGELTLRFDPKNTGIGTIEAVNRLDQNTGIAAITERRVEVRRLDDFGLSGVDFIKIDVEGHEASVVAGGLGVIAASKPILLIECELRHNPTAFSSLEGMLKPFGYSAWYLMDGQFSQAGSGDLPRLQQASGPYVNNFLFVPPERLPAFRALRL